ncbi:MAG: RluA family pseudouridine synthase [Spirochaetia bacterium]|nr:RluA family pseudouridine synthase [Spirochaetia bacterium]
MVEFFYGNSPKHIHKGYSSPCETRCEPLLPLIIGLDILYVDSHIIVVNKPNGLLSVPGIGPDKQDCVVNRVKSLIIESIDSPSVHRLDMDTSGLLVLGLTKESQRDLSIQFMNREVTKSYIALLDGILMQESGEITLPFRLDTENRPYQIYDEKKGKIGTTMFKRIGVEPYKDRHATRVEFTPKTGRTHQLRVHSAHEKGLNMPIIGDRLYGTRLEGERLMLHAATLTFIHPDTKKVMEFVTKAPF